MRVTVVLTLLLALPLLLQAESPILLTPGQDLGEASHLLSYSTSQTAVKTPDRLNLAEFRRYLSRVFNVGQIDGALWLRVEVQNISVSESGRWVLVLDKSSFDDVVVSQYVGGEWKTLFDYWDDEKRIAVFREFGTVAVPFALAPAERSELTVRMVAGNSLLPVAIRTEASQHSAANFRLLTLALLFFGVITFIFVATLPLVFFDRSTFLLYAGSQLSAMALCFHLDGFTTAYLWPEAPEIPRGFAGLGTLFYNLLVLQIARVFFDLRSHQPWLDVMLKGVIYLGIFQFALLLSYFVFPELDRSLATYSALIVASFAWLVLPVLAVYASLAWNKTYWPIAVAWLAMSSFAFSLVLVVTGVIQEMPIGRYFYVVIIYVEAACLAIALALRVREMRLQRDNVDIQMLTLANEKALAMVDAAEKGQILASAGHDARQIISAIKAYSFAMKKGHLGEDVAALSVESLADNLDQLLTTTSSNSQTATGTNHVLALESVSVDNLLGTLRMIHGPAAQQRSLQLRLRSNLNQIATDRAVLLRILSNLVSNALTYTSTGGVLVAIRNRQAGIYCQVMDTGIGMTDDELDALATGGHRFAGEEGTGQGLVSVRKFSQWLGAEFTLTSVHGRGTVATLVLPTPQRINLSHIAILTHAANVLPGLKRIDGIEQVDALTRLILVSQDLHKPDAGIAEAARLKNLHPDIPVVLSSLDRSADTRQKLSAEADALVYEPLSQHLLDQLAFVLRR